MTVQATLAILLVVGVVSGVLILATVLARLARIRRTRSLQRLTGPHRMLLLDVASGEDDDGTSAAALRDLPPRTWAVMQDVVVTMLTKVRGAPSDELVAILAGYGEIERAHEGTRSRSTMRRARSANLLGLARVREAVPDLIPLLSDRTAEVRLVAVRSLGRIALPVAADAVLHAVEPPPGRRGGGVGVPAWVVADALVAMGPQASPVIARGLDDPSPLVRGVAADVAAHSTLSGVLPILRRRLAVEAEPTVRAAVATALGRLGQDEDVVLLASHADSRTDPVLRHACAAALGVLGARDAEPVLLALLADADRRLSTIAADSLVDLGTTGRRALERITEDQGEDAARAARGALELADLREAR